LAEAPTWADEDQPGRKAFAELIRARQAPQPKRPGRFRAVQPGPDDPPSPWESYSIQEIPISNVPEDCTQGQWQHIALDGNELILIWWNLPTYRVFSLPILGGRLTQLATFKGLSARDPHIVRGYKAARIGKDLYLARTHFTQRGWARNRTREDKPMVAANWPALLVYRDGEFVKSYSELDGLPGRSIQAIAAIGGKVYLSIDHSTHQMVPSRYGPGRDTHLLHTSGALVRFDPADKSFTVMASPRLLNTDNKLNGGTPWGITEILADTKRNCLWLRVAQTADDQANPDAPSRSGIWRWALTDGSLEQLYNLPGGMEWFDSDRLTTFGLRLLNANTGKQELLGPAGADPARPFATLNGRDHGPIGVGMKPPFQAHQVPSFAVGDYVLDGLSLCDPKTNLAYPCPRGGLGLTTHFSLRLPGDAGVLVPAKSSLRLFRVAPKSAGTEATTASTRSTSATPPETAAEPPAPPQSRTILVRYMGRFGLLNIDTGQLGEQRYSAYRARDQFAPFANGPLPVKEYFPRFPGGIYGRNYGLIDESGKAIMPCHFWSILPFREGIAGVGVDTSDPHETFKYGFIDPQGKWVIDPTYTAVRSFHEGRAAVSPSSSIRQSYPLVDVPNQEGKWGFCDRTGKLITPIQYEHVQDFSQGLAAVFRPPFGWGYIGRDGKAVILEAYATARPFANDVAWVSPTDQLHYGIDDDYKRRGYDPMIAHHFPAPPCNGLVRDISFNGHWKLIDRTGRELTREITGLVTDFHEGRGWFRPEGEQWGCLDKAGTIVVATRFAAPGQFSQGLARAALADSDGRFGYLDRHGQWAIPPRFAAATNFSENLAAVCVGWQDKYDANDYNEDHAPTGGQWGFVNRQGEWIFPPQFERASQFVNGAAHVVKNGRSLYINQAGEVIFDAGPFWTTIGAYICEVGGQASKAGIQARTDIILRVDDVDMTSGAQVASYDRTRQRTVYLARDDKIFTRTIGPGYLGARVSPSCNHTPRPITIGPDIATETPAIQRTDGEILSYVPED
jgi:hypothetical protein